MFQSKINAGFKISVLFKRNINFPFLQTKKNDVFSKLHSPVTIVFFQNIIIAYLFRMKKPFNNNQSITYNVNHIPNPTFK